MKNLRDLKVIVIDLTKYNDSQLVIISNQLKVVDSLKIAKFLSKTKKDGSIRAWYLPEMDEFLCGQYNRKIDDLGCSYKNMVFNEDIKISLSKKDKDFLLKMKPTVFDTKVRKTIKESVDIKTDVSKQEVISIDDLKSELLVCLENEDYEQASIIRDKIKLWKIE
jgi:hypothetical protein